MTDAINQQKQAHLVGRHLRVVRLHDEPEPVASDGPDAEGGHDDRKVLTSFHQLTQDACSKEDK